MSHEQPPRPPAQPPAAGAGRGGQRRHLRLHPARRQLVDQQHRLPRRSPRAWSASTPARPSGAPAPTWRRSPAVTDRPVRTLINTHHHGDHTFGNYLFPGATIVGHERVRDGILALGSARSAPFWTAVDWGDIELEPPFLTYADRVTVVRRRPALRGPVHAVLRRTPPTTRTCGYPSASCCSAATCSSTAAPRSSCRGRSQGRSGRLEHRGRPRCRDDRARARPGVRARGDRRGHGIRCGSCRTSPRGGKAAGLSPLELPARPTSASTPGLLDSGADRRQPAPRLRRAGRRRTRRAAGPDRRPGRHGRLQRRATAELLRLNKASRPDVPLWFSRPPLVSGGVVVASRPVWQPLGYVREGMCAPNRG